MSTESTPGGVSRQDISDEKPTKRRRLKERPAILRGIPIDLLCRSCDVKEFMGIDSATWDRMKEAGLETYQPGTQAELTFTNDLHAWVKSRAELPPPKPRRKLTK